MAAKTQVQIKGLIRFSYLAQNGFAKSSIGLDASREMLYDPARLERRFEMFKKLALHSLRRQDDMDFKVGILIGDSFPDVARTRLEALIADTPQAQVISLPPRTHIRAVNAAYSKIMDIPGATHTATFRLDDDDAMHRTTTRRIRDIAGGMLAFRPNNDPFGIAFNRGFYFDLDSDQTPITEWYEKTPLGVGMALVAPRGERANAFRRNHRKLGQFFDCYTEIAKPMFIRSVHQDNDSGARPTGRAGPLNAEQIAAELHDGFGMTLDGLRSLC